MHLIKLSVGSKDVGQLAAWQAARAVTHPPLRHRTRMRPKRAAEIEAGGSIYWVVAGFTGVRQRIVEVRDDVMEDGSACVALVLDPLLVPVAARPVKAFQGWRYLTPEAAPPDLGARSVDAAASGEAALPPALAQALRAVGLL
nr:DUF1489 domain-containing protein [Roseomonas acroporae]